MPPIVNNVCTTYVVRSFSLYSYHLVWRLDKWVEWIEAGLELANQIENKTAMELRGFKRKLKETKEVHDDMLLKYGINSLQTKTEHFARAPDSQPAAPLFTSIYPYGQPHDMFSQIFRMRIYDFFLPNICFEFFQMLKTEKMRHLFSF